MRSSRKAPALLAAAFAAATSGLFLAVGGAPGAQAATSCPTVATNGTVTPAPAAGVNWSGCLLAGANLKGADLAGASLSGAILTNADLTDANLTDINLTAASLADTSLGGADFTGATLTGIKYDGQVGGNDGAPVNLPASWQFVSGYLLGPTVSLTGVPLPGISVTQLDLAGATLSDVNLDEASLPGTDFTNATIKSSHLALANLSGSLFTGASLTGSILSQSNLDNANFTNANLTGVTGGNVTWSGTIWSNTTCPDGTNSNVNTSGCGAMLAADGFVYKPIAPARILDTRNGTGAAKAALGAGKTLTLTVPAEDDMASTEFAAVVMNVTAIAPQKSGYLTIYPYGNTRPVASSLNFAAGQTVPNLVTVPVSGGKVSIYNGSAGTVQLIADFSGFYCEVGTEGVGYAPQTPSRVLDTRNGTGAAAKAVSSGVRVRLNLSGKVPAGTTAVTLNVTVTAPQKAGWLAAYPDAPGTPATSNLNFAAGQTVANQVIVPINNGIVDLYNGSPGTIQVVADLDGSYGTSATDYYDPQAPTRLFDTRTGSPVKASGSFSFTPDQVCELSCVTEPVAAILNVTVTQPAKAGYVTVYPENASRPVASSLNFASGQTIANLVTTAVGAPSGFAPEMTFYNGSPGTIQLIVDEEGYFVAS